MQFLKTQTYSYKVRARLWIWYVVLMLLRLVESRALSLLIASFIELNQINQSYHNCM